MRKLLPALALALALTACGRNGPAAAPTETPAASATPAPADTPAPSPLPDTPYPEPSPAPAEPYPEPASLPPDMEQQARDRLARHLGVPADTLRLTAAEAREWGDTSLGCPDPATGYLQVITPGYLLVFSDGAASYELHTGLGAQPGQPIILCANGAPTDLTEQLPQMPVGEEGQRMAELARAALAKELGLDPQRISIITINPVEWNDSSLGCPKPDESYLQVITSGYLVRLDADGAGYMYHTDAGERVVRCDR